MGACGSRLALGLLAGFLVGVSIAQAGVITVDDVYPLADNLVGSGNGTLDLILLTESAGGAGNSAAGFNGDNANTDMPTGGPSLTATESYITSIGELRAFYLLNFPSTPVTDMALFVDLNQITGGLDVVLQTLTVVIDYDAGFGDSRDNPAGNDINSATQNQTGAGFSGGTTAAQLDGPKTLPLVEQGAGFADYAIRLGINPFDPAFSDGTRILFHWASSGHDDGGETIFLSGDYAPHDIPEPESLALLAVAGLAVLRRR